MPTKTGNLMIGNAIFVAFGFFGCLAMMAYVRNATKDNSMRQTNMW